MLTQSDLKNVEKITKEFFDKIGFEAEIEIKAFEERTLPIHITMEDPKILIGEGGKTLSEIQYLLKTMIIRKIKSPLFVDLDINNYKGKKYQYLKELARSVADEAALIKKEKILSPMPASERRIIHLELAERKDVTSESMGEGPDRRVVIRPNP